MIDVFSLRYDSSGRLYTPGIDWGYGDTRPELRHQAGPYVVLYVRPRRNWCGVALPPEYTPALYMLGKWDGERFTKIREEEPGTNWRACLAKMKEEADALNSTKDKEDAS